MRIKKKRLFFFFYYLFSHCIINITIPIKYINSILELYIYGYNNVMLIGMRFERERETINLIFLYIYIYNNNNDKS